MGLLKERDQLARPELTSSHDLPTDTEGSVLVAPAKCKHVLVHRTALMRRS